MAKTTGNRVGILSAVDTKTKLLALIALVAEALFASSLAVLKADQALYALITCAVILAFTIIGIVIMEKSEIDTTVSTPGQLIPSPSTPSSEFLNELINSAIQTVCRAISLPNTPQGTKLRVFIFRKEGNILVCSHFWSQDPVKEQVGKLRFEITSEVAEKVAVVRAVIDERICRTEVRTMPKGTHGVTGDVADNLRFVLAAPIKRNDGTIWGTIDFDAASPEGQELLSTEVSNSVMYQVACHLQVIFSLSDTADRKALRI